MKILVTGSGGMLGTDICQVLSNTGKHLVYGLDNKALMAENDKILDDFIEADIAEEKDLLKNMTDLKPELVIHSAAYTDVDNCELNKEKAELINAAGTRNIALACRKTAAVLFYISTDYVFDGRKQQPYTEEDEPNPINVYGCSKLKGEEHIKALLERYVIIRSSWLFGRRGNNFVDTILTKGAEILNSNDADRRELKVVSNQKGSPTYTRDLAAAIERLLADFTKLKKVYHITNSGVCSWHEFACQIVEAANLSDVTVKPIKANSIEPKRPALRPIMSVLDNGQYNKLTRQPLRSWQEALSCYIKEKI